MPSGEKQADLVWVRARVQGLAAKSVRDARLCAPPLALLDLARQQRRIDRQSRTRRGSSSSGCRRNTGALSFPLSLSLSLLVDYFMVRVLIDDVPGRGGEPRGRFVLLGKGVVARQRAREQHRGSLQVTKVQRGAAWGGANQEEV